MRVTQIQTIFGLVNVDQTQHPRLRFRASFDGHTAPPNGDFGWVALGGTCVDAIVGLLNDHQELLNEMYHGYFERRH